jgi:hypothetical protein
MRNGKARRPLVSVILLVGLFWSASSYPLVVLIDQFEIDKNGVNIFTDTFSNNLTPSQETTTYAVAGSFPNGAESGGLLTLNTDWGALTVNALGQARLTLGAIRLTSITNATLGLTESDTIDVISTFNLVTPPGPLTNGYGIQVLDALVGQPVDRLVELDVQYNAGFGGDVIRYLLQDFTTGTITTLGFVALAPPAGADQVELAIFRPNTSNDNFFGEYAFCTSGICGAFTPFSTPGALFTDTSFVRGRFIDFTAVPEPATISLLGLAALASLASRRRRQ